jgi:hypothetical protein
MQTTRKLCRRYCWAGLRKGANKPAVLILRPDDAFPLWPGLNGIVDSLLFAMTSQAGAEPAALVLTARCFYRAAGELGGDRGWVWFS